MPSTTCLKQDLSIDTILDPSLFSLDSPFKFRIFEISDFPIEDLVSRWTGQESPPSPPPNLGDQYGNFLIKGSDAWAYKGGRDGHEAMTSGEENPQNFELSQSTDRNVKNFTLSMRC